jgi:hypothetical protein
MTTIPPPFGELLPAVCRHQPGHKKNRVEQIGAAFESLTISFLPYDCGLSDQHRW